MSILELPVSILELPMSIPRIDRSSSRNLGLLFIGPSNKRFAPVRDEPGPDI